jgi:hypothetical protein
LRDFGLEPTEKEVSVITYIDGRESCPVCGSYMRWSPYVVGKKLDSKVVGQQNEIDGFAIKTYTTTSTNYSVLAHGRVRCCENCYKRSIGHTPMIIGLVVIALLLTLVTLGIIGVFDDVGIVVSIVVGIAAVVGAYHFVDKLRALFTREVDLEYTFSHLMKEHYLYYQSDPDVFVLIDPDAF